MSYYKILVTHQNVSLDSGSGVRAKFAAYQAEIYHQKTH